MPKDVVEPPFFGDFQEEAAWDVSGTVNPASVQGLGKVNLEVLLIT